MINTAVCLALIDGAEDKKAFEKLMNKYIAQVYAAAHSVISDESLSEDAAIDTFVKFAKHYHRLKELGEKELEGYLYMTARNSAYSLLRKESREKADISIDDIDESKLASLEDFHDVSTIALKQAIKQLDECSRSVLAYMCFYGFNADETAELMGVSRRSVYYYLKKAKSLLGDYV